MRTGAGSISVRLAVAGGWCVVTHGAVLIGWGNERMGEASGGLPTGQRSFRTEQSAPVQPIMQ